MPKNKPVLIQPKKHIEPKKTHHSKTAKYEKRHFNKRGTPEHPFSSARNNAPIQNGRARRLDPTDPRS